MVNRGINRRPATRYGFRGPVQRSTDLTQRTQHVGFLARSKARCGDDRLHRVGDRWLDQGSFGHWESVLGARDGLGFPLMYLGGDWEMVNSIVAIYTCMIIPNTDVYSFSV